MAAAQQRAVHAWKLAVFLHQTPAVHHANERAHGVEEVVEQEGDDDPHMSSVSRFFTRTACRWAETSADSVDAVQMCLAIGMPI
jgi:hypothetical protein